MEALQHGLWLLLSFFSLFPLALSTPVNQTDPSYVPEPNMRGTTGLLWSSTATFALCVWTAIHPNVVPIRGAWHPIYYKLTLMAIAVLVPEVILFFAWAQMRLARHIHKKWREAWRDSNESEWLSMSGAFFVVMGGFVVDATQSGSPRDVDQAEPATRCNETDTDFVTTICPEGFEKLLANGENGIIQLVRSGVLTESHFHHRVIKDKSKATNIAKLLVTVQILWMVVQCIGRKSAGLPITLLEAQVLIQILYSILAYLCWWNKPLDIAEPVSLPLSNKVLSDMGHDIDRESRKFFPNQEFVTERADRGGPRDMIWRAGCDGIAFLGPEMEFWSAVITVINGGLHAILWKSHFPTAVERLLWRMSAIGLGLFPLAFWGIVRGNGLERYALWMCHRLRLRDVSFLRAHLEVYTHASREIDLEDLEPTGERQTEERRDTEESRHTEESRRTEESRDRWAGAFPAFPVWSRFLLNGIAILGLYGYILCAGYLTLEAFISVRSLPAGAYSTVRWSTFFPHF
ncbi:hypothetical protein EDB81DRAFT_829136 [Dactylonectria macrodidyma]|uniref:Uncharacterized protein n=1 Tax=Dactylonectria macrodidyma TaxID=307937 RepID=A0A9P9D2K3_9HYPO|nr:hypothetical protein EDB81DRAFT_829136 [Dactylonectria macrodidyma]